MATTDVTEQKSDKNPSLNYVKTMIVFWISSITGFIYSRGIEPFAISLGFREPYPEYMFITQGLVFGLLGVLIYLNFTGVIEDNTTEKISKKDKVKQLLIGGLSALVIILVTVLIKIFMK